MLTYDLTRRGKLPVYEYLYRCLRRDILSGALSVGEKLPGRRKLAEHLGVSVITVDAAYSQLEAEGCVEARPRRGFFVCARPMPVAEAPAEPSKPGPEAQREWKLDLRSNRVAASLFPVGVWARLTRRALAEGPEELLKAAPHAGIYELREAIAAYLRGYKGMSVRAEQVIVGAGAEYLYMLLSQLFRGAVFALEDPGYPKIRQTYAAFGAVCEPVKLDGMGVDVKALRDTGAAVLHISPAHQYPTGLVTPLPRRQELLAWAESTGGYIIEDDYDSELANSPRPLPTLYSLDSAGRVIYVNTFSQTISPGMRAGYLVLPERLLDTWSERLGFCSCTVPSLEQQVLARFISGGYYERHLSRLRKACRASREGVLAALERMGLEAPRSAAESAGTHFLLRLDTNEPDAEIKSRAARLGIRLAFLSDYAFNPAGCEQHVLVVHCAGLSGEELDDAAGTVAEALGTACIDT